MLTIRKATTRTGRTRYRLYSSYGGKPKFVRSFAKRKDAVEASEQFKRNLRLLGVKR